MTEMSANQREKLIEDLRLVISDAEDLLKMTADEIGETSVGVRQRLQERLQQARDKLATAQSAATERVKVAGRAADDYVRDHPWQSVATGAGIGFLLGLLVGRR